MAEETPSQTAAAADTAATATPASGAAPPAAATSQQDAAAGGADQQQAAPKADAGDGTTLFDLADEADATIPKGADGKATRPDWLPEQFWDAEKGEIRTRDLAKSQADLRAKVSRGEGKVPDKAEGYALPKVEGLPADAVKSDDPLWTKVRTAAHGAGITQKQLDAVLAPYLEYARDQVLNKNPTADRDGMKRAAEEEMKKLGPNGRVLVKDIGAWLAGMEANGSITEGERRAAMAIGSADGINFLLKMREAKGEKPMPLDHLVADTMSESDARKLLLEGKRKGDQGSVDRALAALRRLDQAGVLRAS